MTEKNAEFAGAAGAGHLAAAGAAHLAAGAGHPTAPHRMAPSPSGASASGRRRTLLRVAGTGAVAIVMFPRWMFASMRALLETVTWF